MCDTWLAYFLVFFFRKRVWDLSLFSRYEFMLKEAHVQAWMVVHALINGYGRTQPGCRDDLLAFLFQLSYCKVRATFHPSRVLACIPRRFSWGVAPLFCLHHRNTRVLDDGRPRLGFGIL